MEKIKQPLVGAIVIALILGFFFIVTAGRHELASGEILIDQIAGSGIKLALKAAADSAQAPLGFLLTGFVSRDFFLGEAFPSMLVAVISGLALYLILKKLDFETPIAIAGVFGTSPALYYLGHSLDGYSWLVLITLVGIWTGFKVVTEDSPSLWVWLGLAAAFLTAPMANLPVGVMVLIGLDLTLLVQVLIFDRTKLNRLSYLALIQIFGFLHYVTWGANVINFYKHIPPLPNGPSVIALFSGVVLSLGIVPTVATLGGWLSSFALLKKSESQTITLQNSWFIFVSIWALGLILAPIVVTSLRPYFGGLIPLLVLPLLIGLALALDRLSQLGKTWLIVSYLVLAIILVSNLVIDFSPNGLADPLTPDYENTIE